MTAGGAEIPFNGGQPQGRITLQEAIDLADECQICDGKYFEVILAAAKAFACEPCKGKGWVFGEPERGHRKMLNCPACAEYRRVAKEGVEV